MECVEKDKWLEAAYKELSRYILNGTWRAIKRSRDYVDKILARFGLENCKVVATLIDEKEALIPRIKVGTLVWLMVSTRLDISYVTTKLARHAKNPESAISSPDT
ncbi:hypothetical protein N7491_005424 [Penicillium cf. griseofulvum]|nr:hypothetical protein N7491_005424 [Penicillium cf. griseofulvum]